MSSKSSGHARNNHVLNRIVENLALLLSSTKLVATYHSYRLIWLHCWEKHDILDADFVGEEHSDTVDAATPTCSWWQAVLERGNVVVVNVLGFEVTLVLGFSLLVEAFELYLWIIQLGVGVYDFVIVAEELKSFGETLLASVPFRKWRHQDWSVGDVGWVLALWLQVLADKLVNESSCRPWWLAIQSLLFDEIIKEFS